MRRIRMLLLLCVVVLAAIFFMVGCGRGGIQGQGGQQENTTNHQSANVLLKMHPEGNSGVSGMASFEDTSDGVAVKLEVRNLPKPDPTRSTSLTSTLALVPKRRPMSMAVRTARKGTATNTAGAVTNTGEALTSMAELKL